MFESNRNSKCCKDGEGWSDGSQGGSSRHSQECEGPRALGRGFAVNRVPRPDGEALGAAHGRDGGGIAERQRQPVARNRATGTGKVDGEGVAKSLQLRKGGQGDGVKNRPVHLR